MVKFVSLVAMSSAILGSIGFNLGENKKMLYHLAFNDNEDGNDDGSARERKVMASR